MSSAAESIRREGLGGTFDLENKLHEDAAGMCRELLGMLLDVDGEAIPENEAKPGEHYAGRRGRTVRTLFGDVRCEARDYYYDRDNGTGRYPFDRALGLINGSTPALVARALRHSVKEPYAEAASDFSLCMSRHMTADIMMTYPAQLGEKAESFLAERLSPDRSVPECVCVMADGTGVPLRRRELEGVKGKGADGKAKTREIKVGAVFTSHPDPDNPEERARDPGSTTFVATTERKDVFAWKLRGEFDRRFKDVPKVTLFIADGAHWLWDIRRTHFPFAVEILDFYHAAEHLEPILEMAGYIDGEKERVFKRWRKWLSQGRVGHLIEVADELVGGTKEGRKAIGYFRNNRKRMKYDEYLARGWFIGSGVVESGCKTVIGQRFKQSGMIWSKKGLDALLPFRIAYKSGRYGELWQYIIREEKQLKVS